MMPAPPHISANTRQWMIRSTCRTQPLHTMSHDSRKRERESPENSPTILCFDIFRPPDLTVNMTTSRRLADRKVEKFEKNITKRGSVPETTTKKGSDYPVGPVLLGFFVFVVIGSLVQIVSSLTLFVSISVLLSTGQMRANLASGLLVPALFQIIRTATSGGVA
ncbi:hypothetical protein CK203_030697 [Vitis vinifera]|uniref:Uncharacterized protein n=1 Tax=Vitis vinifera TaxID=29760 RepID=A0A438IRG3_VITVI|nr:hypothetical protein CK203_030697 [Vitis vinifera]